MSTKRNKSNKAKPNKKANETSQVEDKPDHGLMPRDTVYQIESDCIRERRKAAGLSDGSEPKPGMPRLYNTTGLALAGGGVRAASFHLGLIQSLHHRGLFRHLDYLSTVSGGSYIGAAVTSIAHQLSKKNKKLHEATADTQTPHQDNQTSEADRGFSLGYTGSGKQDTVDNLLRRSSNFDWLLHAANSYLVGLLLICLLFGSIVLAIAAFIAITWRMLDTPPIAETILLSSTGLFTDSIRPFLPAVVFLLAWMLGQLIATRHDEPEDRLPTLRWRSYYFFIVFVPLLITTITIGIVYYTIDSEFKDNVVVEIFMKPMLKDWQTRPVLKFGLMLPLLLTVAWPLAWMLTTQKHKLNHGYFLKWSVAIFGAVWLLLYIICFLPSGIDVWVAAICLPIVGIVSLILWHLAAKKTNTLTTQANDKDAVTRLDVAVRLRLLLLLAGASVLIGLVVWMSTPEPNVAIVDGVRPNRQSTLHNYVVSPLLGLLATTLLPLLRPQRLLESGINPQHSWEPILFKVTTYAALLGVPLIAVWYFAEHNYSNVLPDRPNPDAATIDLQSPYWGRLVKRIDQEKRDPFRPNQLLRDAIQPETISDNRPVKLLGEDYHKHEAAASRFNALIETDKIVGFYRGRTEEHRKKIRELVQDGEHPDKKEILAGLNALDQRVYLNWRNDRRKILNRQLLEAFYPDGIKRMTEIRRPNVIFHDQIARLISLVVLLLIVLFAAYFINMNRISMHRFYRDYLGNAFLAPLGKKQAKAKCLTEFQDCVNAGAPYPILNATNQTKPNWVKSYLDTILMSDEPLDNRQTMTPFIFSPKFCGPNHQGQYLATEAYSANTQGNFYLRDAIAISGGSVTPTRSLDFLKLILMTALNMRLGQWMPSLNPNTKGVRRPTLWRLIAKFFRRSVGNSSTTSNNSSDENDYNFLTDGGNLGTLGVEQLLARRCKVIIVSDATSDPSYEFADFQRLQSVARQEGIRFTQCDPSREEPELSDEDFKNLWPSEYRTDVKNDPRITDARPYESASLQTKDHFVIAGIHYPEDGLAHEPNPKPSGYLVYMKPTISGDEPFDLLGHWARHRNFPHDSQARQFLNVDELEAYRQLGFHIGETLCKSTDNEFKHIPDLYEWVGRLGSEKANEKTINKDEANKNQATPGESTRQSVSVEI